MGIAVMAEGRGCARAAAELAERLDLEMLREASHQTLLLVRTPDRLELREPAAPGALALSVEFRSGRGPALLRRATLAGKGVTRVIDSTAGLGLDAFALAEWGCRVELIERSKVVSAMLEDGLERALRQPESAGPASRMSLHSGDALELLPRLAPTEVVYLDPMYPVSGREGRKGKGMRLLRELLGDDPDADRLLETARQAASRRVVVKRPLRAPVLAGVSPSGSLRGTTIRYDLYGPLGGR